MIKIEILFCNGQKTILIFKFGHKNVLNDVVLDWQQPIIFSFIHSSSMNYITTDIVFLAQLIMYSSEVNTVYSKIL